MSKRRTRLKQSDIPAVMDGGGVPIRVELLKMVADEGEEECHGCYVPFEQLIQINQYHPKATLTDTLVHEWLHARLHLAGVSALLEGREGLEEALVRCITSAIMPAIDLQKLCIPSTSSYFPVTLPKSSQDT